MMSVSALRYVLFVSFSLQVAGIYCLFRFFFQAEDGIRDWSVTGVQTCALPILPRHGAGALARRVPARARSGAACRGRRRRPRPRGPVDRTGRAFGRDAGLRGTRGEPLRSEERRVGKEGRSGGRGEAATEDAC